MTRFIDGKTLTPADLQVRPICDATPGGAAGSKLHGAWDGLTGEILYFCPFQTVRTYARTAVRLKASMKDDLGGVLDDARQLSRQIALLRPVLCHKRPVAGQSDRRRRLSLACRFGIRRRGASRSSTWANASANVGLEATTRSKPCSRPIAATLIRGILASCEFSRPSRPARGPLGHDPVGRLPDIDFLTTAAYAADNLAAFREAALG